MSVIDEFSEQITDAVVVLYCSTVTKREFEQSSMWKLVEQRHYIDLCYMMETEAVTLHEWEGWMINDEVDVTSELTSTFIYMYGKFTHHWQYS